MVRTGPHYTTRFGDPSKPMAVLENECSSGHPLVAGWMARVAGVRIFLIRFVQRTGDAQDTSPVAQLLKIG